MSEPTRQSDRTRSRNDLDAARSVRRLRPGARASRVGTFSSSAPARNPATIHDAPIGNGRAISILAAREGARIACVDRERSRRRGHAAAHRGRRRRRRRTRGGCERRRRLCAQLVAEAEAALGGLDGVVVNVGIGLGRSLANTRRARMGSDVRHQSARAFSDREGRAAASVGRRFPRVHQFNRRAIKPGTGIPAYDASKAGLAGLCRHVAHEGARHGVRANLVVPGLIDTPLGRAASRGRPSRARNSYRWVDKAQAGKSLTRRCSCCRAKRATSLARRLLSTEGCPPLR